MTFSFHNRIRLQDNKRLDIGADRYDLTTGAGDAERVVLQSGIQDQRIKDVGELFFGGRGYADFESAFAAGIKWRQIVSAVLARLATGTEFGDHERENLQPQTVDPGFVATLGLDATQLWYKDRIGLLVFETDPPARFGFLSADGMGFDNFPLHAPALISAAQGRHSGEWNDELTLAYQLVHASLTDSRNHEARFILAVTAIEALIPYRERIPEVVAILDSLISHVNNMPETGSRRHRFRLRRHRFPEIDDETRNVVLRLLDSDKFDSVRSFGLKLSDRLTRNYAGMSPRKYFDYVYGTRSDLAHGNLRNVPRLSRDALNQEFTELWNFVLDLLEAWTPDYSGR
jgi:hypothetical protein